MSTVSHSTHSGHRAEATGPTSTIAVDRSRLAGIGALVFAAEVIAATVITFDSPMVDADTAEVMAYFQDAGGRIHISAALFAVGGPAIFVFLAGIWARYRDTPAAGLARLGTLGFLGVAATFATTLVMELAGTVLVDRVADPEAAIATVWAIEGAAFGLVMVFLAVALFGLSGAAASDGAAPRWMRPVGMVGAGLMWLAGALVGPSLTIPAIGGLGLLGFLTWLLFLVVTGVRMARS